MSIKPPSSDSSIAVFETVDFSKLLEHDATEQYKLLDLSTRDGFFYLELQGPCITQILSDRADIVHRMEWYFALPESKKAKDICGTHAYGYKPPGTFTGFKKGSRDCNETLKVAYTETMAKSELLPAAVKECSYLFNRFIRASHFVNKTLLTRLRDILSLEGHDRFEEYHRNEKNLQYNTRAFIILSRHWTKAWDTTSTPIGLTTLLFTEQWGLQLQQPQSTKWSFVEPREGHAIINIGDSLHFLSGKRFNSCLHCVIPVAADEDRYSIAYFLKPENAAHLEDTD